MTAWYVVLSVGAAAVAVWPFRRQPPPPDDLELYGIRRVTRDTFEEVDDDEWTLGDAS